ncbi:hypothetical protein [Actinoplanes sp. GCM10030250]|uniref:hypothetical protein n=1 Tax=Actinoplanes sp. GCM10030250 TaxID=3273376 RepID=UPI00360E0A47
MATASHTQVSSTQPIGFLTLSRTLVSLAADVATGVQRAVVGPASVRTARDNAWDAILADRARAKARADTSRAVAALIATTPSHHTRTLVRS